MTKREQKWSEKYSAVVNVSSPGFDKPSLFCWGKCGHAYRVRPETEACLRHPRCRLLYLNPEEACKLPAWLRALPKHPDYFGYQEPPAEPEPFTPKLDDKVKGKPGAKDMCGVAIPAHTYGRVVWRGSNNTKWQVRWYRNGTCVAGGWYTADALEAME